jgi:plasmid stabilization system protein ParE
MTMVWGWEPERGEPLVKWAGFHGRTRAPTHLVGRCDAVLAEDGFVRRRKRRNSRKKEEKMPRAWSRKDERKYERIKESGIERGIPADRAEEIAARTVNKARREEGRTPNRRTQGTGNPNRPLEQRTRDELYNRARELNIPGRSRMTKDELVAAIRRK